MLKNFIILFFLVFALFANAQSNGVLNNTNSEPGFAGTEEKVSSDTINTKNELMEIESVKSRSIKKSKAVPSAQSDIPVPAAPAQKAELNNASYEFQNSKNAASTQTMQRSPSEDQQKSMDEVVEFFETHAPESFEFHYYKYLAGNYDISLINHLNEAEKLRPDNSDVHVQKAAYHIIQNEKDKALTYLSKLRKDDRLQKDLSYYAEDLLLSVPVNGVLITHGFDDTYSAFYSQLKDKVRTDVTIISLDFLQSEAYRKTIRDKGFKMPSSTVIDVNYLANFCSMNEARKIAVSLTTPKAYFSSIQDKLYVTGLAFEYHSESYDNLHRNEKLWNSTLKKHLVYNASKPKTKQLSSNYLPMLLVLYKSYKENGETDKLKEIDEASNKVSVQCNKYNAVRQMKDAY